MTENREEMEAFRTISKVLDQRVDDLKLRGKTYQLTEAALMAAAALIQATRQEGELSTMVTSAAMAITAGTHPELLEEGALDNLTRKQQRVLTTEGIETIFAVALNTLRQGMDGVEELDETCRKLVRNQGERVKDLVGTPEWETIQNSPNFKAGTIKNIMNQIEGIEEKGEFPEGMYL